MNISQAAKFTGLSSKTIRFYEEKGVIPKPSRSQNGYRLYSGEQLLILGFIKNARSLDFSLDECKELLVLMQSQHKSSAEVKNRVLRKLDCINEQIHHLEEVKSVLIELSNSCPGDGSDKCPILEALLKEQQRSSLQ
ncbi:MAG: Cu(I)-responsive transcriptional regulator [Neptuniibacter sp.]